MKKIFTVLFAVVIAFSITTVASAQSVSESEIEVSFFKGVVVVEPEYKPDKGGISIGGKGEDVDISVLDGNEHLGNANVNYAEPVEGSVLLVGNQSGLGLLPKTGSHNGFAVVLIFMGVSLITATIFKRNQGEKGEGA